MHCFWCKVTEGTILLLGTRGGTMAPTRKTLWSVDWLPADTEVVKHIKQ